MQLCCSHTSISSKRPLRIAQNGGTINIFPIHKVLQTSQTKTNIQTKIVIIIKYTV